MRVHGHYVAGGRPSLFPSLLQLSIAIHLRHTYTNINPLPKLSRERIIDTTDPQNTTHIDRRHV
jgi:hypothetical protein